MRSMPLSARLLPGVGLLVLLFGLLPGRLEGQGVNHLYDKFQFGASAADVVLSSDIQINGSDGSTGSTVSLGDLGLSTGPWRAEGERDGKPFAAHGHFFTVWKNDGRGHWQVLFDHGVGHAPPPTPVETTALVALPVGKADASGRSAVESRRAALTAADDALRERLAGGASGAYASLASADTLWLRDGALPQRGAQPPGAEGAPSVCGCGPRIRIGMAASADFGYTIGGREDQRDKGIDVRIWKFDGSGWSLVADLVAAVQ